MRPLVALALFVTLAIAACGGDDGVTVTPTPLGPSSVPWTVLPGGAAILDATVALSADEREAWVMIDPDTGAFRKLPSIDGYVPGRLSGNRYALTAAPSGLVILDVAQRSSTGIGTAWAGEVSPDGRWAAVIPAVEGPTLEVVDVKTGARTDLGNLGKPVQLSWSADDRLAIVRNETLFIAEGPDWTPRTVGAFPYARAIWSFDGRLTFADSEGIHVASADLTDVETIVSSAELPSPAGMSWSAQGQLAANPPGSGVYVAFEGEVRSRGAAPRAPTRLWESYYVSPFGVDDGSVIPIWSPDGSAMAFFSENADQGINGIVVARADGKGAYQLTAGTAVEVIGWTDEGILARVYQEP